MEYEFDCVICGASNAKQINFGGCACFEVCKVCEDTIQEYVRKNSGYTQSGYARAFNAIVEYMTLEKWNKRSM